MTAVGQLSYLADLCLLQAGSPREHGFEFAGDAPQGDDLLRGADRVGVFPAVFQRIRSSGASAWEDSRWDREFRSVVARNLLLRRTQDKLLAVLHGGGVRCQPVKGVRLAQRLYGDLGSRESFDIDLICPADEVPAVYARLKSLGLRDLTDAWTEEGLRRALSQPEFLFPEIKLTAANGTLVEMHWDWTGEAFPVGDPLDDVEAYAVYLCRHAAKHFWCSLQWICDIELLLRKTNGNFDWPRFWRLAERANAVRDCAASVEICGELFGNAAVRRVNPLRRIAAKKLARKAIEALASPAGREQTRAHPARRLLQVDGWNRRMRRCWHWLAPAPRCYNEAPAGNASVAAVWSRRYVRFALGAIPASKGFARWRRRLTTASRLSVAEWAEIARAGVCLTQAQWALARKPLTEVARWATSGATGRTTGADRVRETVYRSKRAVRLAAQVHPIEMKCLPRALALAKLLAARGIAINLKLGIRREEGRFAGHAWVEWKGEALNESAPVVASYAELNHSLDDGAEVFDTPSA